MTHVETELNDIRKQLLPLDLDDSSEVIVSLDRLEEEILQYSLGIKRLAHRTTTCTPPPSEGNGV